MSEVAQLLVRAADKIDQGWGKALIDTRGYVCAMGALNWAAFGDPRIYPWNDGVDPQASKHCEQAEVILKKVMQAHFRSDLSIRSMNDQLARGGYEISNCMRKAAREIMGDIGDNPRKIEVLPETQPVRQPIPEPAPPVKEPEKVPA